MSILNKRSILKLATIFMVVAMMAGAFATHPKIASATGCTGLGGTSIPGDIPADTGTHNCDLAVTITPNDVLNLTFTSDATVTTDSNEAPGVRTFTFHTTVVDTRDTEEGWRLQAASAGLLNGSHTPIALAITTSGTSSTGTDGTCTITPASGADCGTVASGALSLTSSPTPFMTDTATSGTSPVSGTFAITVAGTYTIPAGAFGTYTGALTLSLLNTSA